MVTDIPIKTALFKRVDLRAHDDDRMVKADRRAGIHHGDGAVIRYPETVLHLLTIDDICELRKSLASGIRDSRR